MEVELDAVDVELGEVLELAVEKPDVDEVVTRTPVEVCELVVLAALMVLVAAVVLVMVELLVVVDADVDVSVTWATDSANIAEAPSLSASPE